MATNVEVPTLGESVKTAVLVKWHKADGESVKVDEPILELETDKANVDVPAPQAGVVRRLKEEGEQVAVGEVIARIDDGGAGAVKTAAPAAKAAQVSGSGAGAVPPASTPPASPSAGSAGVALEDYSPAVRAMIEENHLDPKQIRATGPSGRLTKEDVQAYLDKNGNGAAGTSAAVTEAPPPSMKPAAPPPPQDRPKNVATTAGAAPQPSAVMQFDSNGVHRAKMSKMRAAIARRLVEAQHTAAILTTFNEVDLTEVIALRAKFKDRFQEVHGIGLGFMSFFARATVLALREFPRVNASIEGDEIVYHQYVHLGIAVSTDRGLAVPVLRNVQDMGFARIESEIKRVATAVRDGKLGLEELSGGTFTITNGGVFGSLLSTPIINPPQSGILGMHAIQKRPMVVNDKIEVRSMMYVALSYDHRLVDGRESVSFLVRLKQYLEDPARLMLEI